MHFQPGWCQTGGWAKYWDTIPSELRHIWQQPSGQTWGCALTWGALLVASNHYMKPLHGAGGQWSDGQWWQQQVIMILININSRFLICIICIAVTCWCGWFPWQQRACHPASLDSAPSHGLHHTHHTLQLTTASWHYSKDPCHVTRFNLYHAGLFQVNISTEVCTY